MNTYIKYALFVASGAVLGASGGYYAAKKQYEEEISDLNDVANAYRADNDQFHGLVADLEEAGIDISTVKKIAEQNRQKKLEADSKIYDTDIKTEPTNYNKPVDVKEEEKDLKEDNDPVVLQQDFYMINSKEYDEGEPTYKKEQATYYVEDKVLCDDRSMGQIPTKFVGQENLDILAANDLDVIYVRNDKVKADYEIAKYEGSYSYEVLGEEALDN